MNKILVYSVFVFSFFLIVGNSTENINIYASSIICLIYITYRFLKMVQEKFIRINIERQELTLLVLLISYVIFTLCLGIYYGIENLSIYKVLFNSLYICTFILLVIDSKWTSEFTVTFARLFGYSFIFMGLVGIILYFLGIYAIKFTFTPPFFKVYDEDSMLSFFGEIRFQSIFSHKTKYAFYCLMGMFILRINSIMSKKVRVFGILVLSINIILTNSVMSLIAMIIVWATIIDYKKINIYFRYMFYCMVGLVVGLSGIFMYDYMSGVRDLSTWGSRKIIWENAIAFLKDHPVGVIDNWYFYRLDNHFQGAHNVFLNEFLDYGLLGGVLFLFVYISYFYSLFKIDKRTIGIMSAITLLFMVDNILYYDIVPIFWLFYVAVKIIVRNNKMLLYNGKTFKGD
ncbi:hypothetical protein COL13_12275 [Bacillus cereus]|nr:hypothetical protein COL13_12275 [Bacillus cereus]